MVSNNITSYEHKFLDEPPDALRCLICLEVAEDPWQHGKGGCGRLFCRKCLDKNGRKKACPNCRIRSPEYFEDSRSKREIKVLAVKCDSVDKGCEWTGTLGTLADHTSTCALALIPCPNECEDDNGETELIMRKNLDQHLKECPERDYKCVHCGEEDSYYGITEIHDHHCEMKVIPCTNEDCAIRLQRRKMNDHVWFECEHTVIACKHRSIGCEEKMKRKEMAVHEKNSDLHLDMAIETIFLLKEQCSVLSLVDGEYTTTFTLREYENKKRTNAVHCSPSFYIGRNGYHMRIAVFANGNGSGKGTHISVCAQLLDRRHDKELNWPLVGAAKITLLNQERDEGHYSKTIELKNSKACIIRGLIEYIKHSELESELYHKNDSLHFKVSITVNGCKPWLE